MISDQEVKILIKDLEQKFQEYRKHFQISRDEKKKFFWLGKQNTTSEIISLLKKVSKIY